MGDLFQTGKFYSIQFEGAAIFQLYFFISMQNSHSTILFRLSERKKRLLLKTDVSLQRRIQLMQDFAMPIASQCIRITPDQTHIYASGVYPPRLR